MSVVQLENGDYLIEGVCVATDEYFEVQVPSTIQDYIDQKDPSKMIQENSVNKAIKFVKMGDVKKANKVIKPAIDYLKKKNCKKIVLGCTELPIALFAFKSFKTIKSSKLFLDPNFILANAAMKKYKNR